MMCVFWGKWCHLHHDLNNDQPACASNLVLTIDVLWRACTENNKLAAQWKWLPCSWYWCRPKFSKLYRSSHHVGVQECLQCPCVVLCQCDAGCCCDARTSMFHRVENSESLRFSSSVLPMPCLSQYWTWFLSSRTGPCWHMLPLTIHRRWSMTWSSRRSPSGCASCQCIVL